jgi:hypothetical protein
MRSKGKLLENSVKTHLKQNADWFHKFTDSYASRGFAQPVPSDFLIIPDIGPCILLECKMTEKARLSLSAFRPIQFHSMRNSLHTEQCNYYVLINYNKAYYLIGAQTIIDILDSGEKSIYLEDGFLAIEGINNAMDTLMLDNRGEL